MSTTKDSPVLYTEDTQTPTNVNTTVQASITKSEDGVILEQYQDQNKQDQYATTPNTNTEASKSSTGSGLDAAENTEYSWDTKAKERAELSYKTQVLEAKSQYLTNRQELESQGQQMQEQTAMQKYSQNQSNEKAGWTGGYVLDTERQMTYLKQTIQSQMYGAMELQKYGYDTSLAAARLAYDTNKYDLALEYYNTALQVSVTEAEITGYYLSPETKEMLNQYSIAANTLNDPTAKEPEKQRADTVLDSVYKWFESNGISKQGVETYSHLVDERTHKMSVLQTYKDLWLDKNQTQLSTDEFAMFDESGDYLWTDEEHTRLKTFNFGTSSPETIIDYIKNDKSGKAAQQYYTRLDSIGYEMVDTFESYLKTKVEDPSKLNENTTLQYFKQWIESSDTADKLGNELNRFKDVKDYETIAQLIKNYEVDITLPNGTPINLHLEIGKASYGNTNNSTDNTTEEEDKKLSETILEEQINIENLINELENTDVETYQNNAKEYLETVNTSKLEDYQKDVIQAGIEIVQTGVAFIPVVGTMAATAIEVAQVWFNGIDEDTANEWASKKDEWEKIRNEFESSLGESNLKLLKESVENYNSLTDAQKNNLDPVSKKTLEDACSIYDSYSQLNKAIKYASNRDSTFYTGGMYEYTADKAKQIAEKWEDGYQFGDGITTAADALSLVIIAPVETVVKPLVKIGKGFVNGIKSGWKKLKFW